MRQALSRVRKGMATVAAVLVLGLPQMASAADHCNRNRGERANRGYNNYGYNGGYNNGGYNNGGYYTNGGDNNRAYNGPYNNTAYGNSAYSQPYYGDSYDSYPSTRSAGHSAAIIGG